MRLSLPPSSRRDPRRRTTTTKRPTSITPATSRRRRSAGSTTPALGARRSTPVVRRITLGVLLLASFALITATYRGGVAPRTVQMQVVEVVAPIQRGMNAAWDPLAGAWSWTGRLFSAVDAQPRLERENAELRTALRVATAQRDEDAAQLRLLHMSEQGVYPRGLRQVVGRIIVQPVGIVDRTVMIDVGTRNGISVDDAVMVAEGLIGRVLSVSAHNAVVGLILDSAQQPTARIIGADGGVNGILQTVSTDGVPAMRVDQVPQRSKISVGDEVVTAGFSTSTLRSRYPSNIPIGQVTSVRDSASSEYKTIQVVPYADFDNLRFVSVLVAQPGAETRTELTARPPRRERLRAELEAARATQQDAAARTRAAARARARAAADARTPEGATEPAR